MPVRGGCERVPHSHVLGYSHPAACSWVQFRDPSLQWQSWAAPTQLFLKGAGPGPSYLQTLKISVKNNQNMLKCCLEEEKKEKSGKNPVPTAAAVESGATGTPWAGWAEGHLPHGWRARGASSLSFGSHVAFPPVWKTTG